MIDANQSRTALIGVAKSRAFATQIHGVIDLSPSVNTILDIHFQPPPLYGLLCHSTSLSSSLDVREARNLSQLSGIPVTDGYSVDFS